MDIASHVLKKYPHLFDGKEVDLDNLPEGYELDYVWSHVGRPNRMVLGTLPWRYRLAAFEKADAHRKTTQATFALPIIFKKK